MRPYPYNVGLAYAGIASDFSQHAALRFAGGRVVTHEELNDAANRMAALLAGRGLRRGDVIGIVHTKTLPCYAAMLAALKLGAAYVNLDDQNPPARLRHILGTARPKFIVAQDPPPGLSAAFEQPHPEILAMSDSRVAGEYERAPAGEPAQSESVTGADPAYIMYTSGSTGVPKGALMTHANVLNFGAWAAKRFAIGASDTLTNVNPMYFDNSVFDFYGSLLNGAALAPMARETVANPPVLLEQVEAAGCTVWFSVPSLLIYLTTLKLMTPLRLPAIRAFVFGGEGYPKPELRKLFAAYGTRSRLINVYGPTECTCICSAWDVRAQDLEDPNGLVTLGPVAENFSMLVLSDDQPVAPGEVGELCLLGPQVGLGYVNDAERTGRSFAPNPLNARWAERMYRTGDLVRLGSDERTLDFVGRADNQIKHMGYRIELEEIEAALHQIDGIVQAAVLHRAGRRETKLLVAYVAAERDVTDGELRLRLADLLPPYMIPQQFKVRPALPKNANGKVDRIALAAESLE
jgi:D-alanine--poly(phosphoribitol) ligase subunit 1